MGGVCSRVEAKVEIVGGAADDIAVGVDVDIDGEVTVSVDVANLVGGFLNMEALTDVIDRQVGIGSQSVP